MHRNQLENVGNQLEPVRKIYGGGSSRSEKYVIFGLKVFINGSSRIRVDQCGDSLNEKSFVQGQ